ncbi:MAG: YtxH domain-containing protein [Candidatus Nealsonbacteria bacterium]|nr:YtxH domain-containing protein [Candidatus Nealsonbacteria bacterium]
MKGNKLSLLEGAVIGTALGVTAGLFLASKKGKQLQKNINQKTVEFYAYIAPKLKKIKKLGEKEYIAFVETAAKNYSKAKKFSAVETKILLAEAKKAWKHLKKHAS